MIEDDYDPTDLEESSIDYISLKYKEKVVALANAYPKWNLSTLQKKNGQYASRLKRKDHLKRWKEDVKKDKTKIEVTKYRF